MFAAGTEECTTCLLSKKHIIFQQPTQCTNKPSTLMADVKYLYLHEAHSIHKNACGPQSLHKTEAELC